MIFGWRVWGVRVGTNNELVLHCPSCGGVLARLPPGDRCVGLVCTQCDYAVVTTNPDFRAPYNDPTLYDVWLDWPPDCRKEAIAAAANLSGCGVQAARNLVDAGLPVKSKVKAPDVQLFAKLARYTGFPLRIVPEFPWPLEGDLPRDRPQG